MIGRLQHLETATAYNVFSYLFQLLFLAAMDESAESLTVADLKECVIYKNPNYHRIGHRLCQKYLAPLKRRVLRVPPLFLNCWTRLRLPNLLLQNIVNTISGAIGSCCLCFRHVLFASSLR